MAGEHYTIFAQIFSLENFMLVTKDHSQSADLRFINLNL